jgi:hypothetical protein
MTNSTTVADDGIAPSADVDTAPRSCSVCGHESAAHDPISRRYCAATQANALTRDCICPPSRGA